MFTYHNTGLFVIIGLFLIGMGTAYVVIPVMPEILTALEEWADKAEMKVNKKVLEDNCSGYFVFFQALGEMIGPSFSSMLERQLEFRLT